MTPEEAVERWLAGARVEAVQPLTGGDVNEVSRVDTDAGAFVLRIYAAETDAAMVAWEHALLARLAGRVPEVLTPLATPDGATFVEDGGHVVSLWRFVEGRRAERSIEGDRLGAASLLGRLHASAAALAAPAARPGYPRWALDDWQEHRLWSWARADRASVAAHVDLEGFERVLEELPAAVRALDGDGLPSMPIHGDYYADNLLVSEGEISAVLDWDECRVDWRAWETANAVWSFCRDGSRIAIDAAMADAFLGSYVEAGGEVLSEERAAFPLLIRATRLREALYVLGEIERGIGADWDYFEMNVAAIEGLRALDLD